MPNFGTQGKYKANSDKPRIRFAGLPMLTIIFGTNAKLKMTNK